MPTTWPALPYDSWAATCDTLHAHTQVLGKLAAALAPPEPQLQHTALRLTGRGWETLPLPAPDGSGALAVALDLRTHQAVVEHSDGRVERVAPSSDESIMRNPGHAQQMEAGWWPGDGRYPRAAFLAYAYPAPDGFAAATLSPAAAHWDAGLGEYVLDWDDARASPAPHRTALDFAQSSVRHACAVCGWDPALSASVQGVPPPIA